MVGSFPYVLLTSTSSSLWSTLSPRFFVAGVAEKNRIIFDGSTKSVLYMYGRPMMRPG